MGTSRKARYSVQSFLNSAGPKSGIDESTGILMSPMIGTTIWAWLPKISSNR